MLPETGPLVLHQILDDCTKKRPLGADLKFQSQINLNANERDKVKVELGD